MPRKRASAARTSSILPTYSWSDLSITGGRARRLHYITNIRDAQVYLSRLAGPAIGLDVEWKPKTTKWANENPIALVQLADADTVLLIHISCMDWKVPLLLQDVLEDDSILKVGVGIEGDRLKLARDLGINMSGNSCVELSELARSVDEARWESRRGKLISLAQLTEVYVQRTLEKLEWYEHPDWEEELERNMQEYAANDAAAGLSVYQALLDI